MELHHHRHRNDAFAFFLQVKQRLASLSRVAAANGATGALALAEDDSIFVDSMEGTHPLSISRVILEKFVFIASLRICTLLFFLAMRFII
jgi:hypothetical protein